MITSYAFPDSPPVYSISPSPSQIYRQFFTAAECNMLDSSAAEAALSEISLLRILLVRVLAAARRKGTVPPQGRVAMLVAFSGTALTMVSLARFQEKYFGLHTLPNPLLEALASMDPDDL